MSGKEMPAAYRFSILFVVIAIGTLVGTGDLILAGTLLAIAGVVYVGYSLIKKT